MTGGGEVGRWRASMGTRGAANKRRRRRVFGVLIVAAEMEVLYYDTKST
jgi:hypothetical protein